MQISIVTWISGWNKNQTRESYELFQIVVNCKYFYSLKGHCDSLIQALPYAYHHRRDSHCRNEVYNCRRPL